MAINTQKDVFTKFPPHLFTATVLP